MKAFVIAAETIHDEAASAEYRRQVPATVEPFGSTFVVRGGAFTCLEGQWPHKRTVITEFPSRQAAEGWYRSAAYQAIIGLRLASTTSDLIIIDGPA
jgi:uncharacterized protein (DUF1330 family)